MDLLGLDGMSIALIALGVSLWRNPGHSRRDLASAHGQADVPTEVPVQVLDVTLPVRYPAVP